MNTKDHVRQEVIVLSKYIIYHPENFLRGRRGYSFIQVVGNREWYIVHFGHLGNFFLVKIGEFDVRLLWLAFMVSLPSSFPNLGLVSDFFELPVFQLISCLDRPSGIRDRPGKMDDFVLRVLFFNHSKLKANIVNLR